MYIGKSVYPLLSLHTSLPPFHTSSPHLLTSPNYHTLQNTTHTVYHSRSPNPGSVEFVVDEVVAVVVVAVVVAVVDALVAVAVVVVVVVEGVLVLVLAVVVVAVEVFDTPSPPSLAPLCRKPLNEVEVAVLPNALKDKRGLPVLPELKCPKEDVLLPPVLPAVPV